MKASLCPSVFLAQRRWTGLRQLFPVVVCCTLAACANMPMREMSNPSELLQSELSVLKGFAAQTQPASDVEETTTPAEPASDGAARQPNVGSLPVADATAIQPRVAPPPEPRFDLIVNGALVRDVFLSMVTDTRYSMLIHPEVSGQMSVTLKGVTLLEALESIRDVYGFDFQIDGRRITVFPPTMQTRIFVVNYLHTPRQGRSEVRVSSGSAPANNGGQQDAAGTSTTARAQLESSHISTTSRNDFWTEVTEALRAIVGSAGGRYVIASPQAGTIAVRAMPDELRHTESFLRTTRLSVERQVMLEAKIVEIELREGFQSGIDWSVLRSRAMLGQTSGVSSNALLANSNGLPTFPAANGADGLADMLPFPAPGSGTFGLSLGKRSFQAILGFLETNGDIQILSSPRVATLNNQKAVLKVGTDEYFVTNVSGGSITAGTSTSNGTTTLPTLTLTPFFSGIALDVTPQIDGGNMITLHIHPAVTSVTEKTKQVDLGTIGNYRLPLASSNVNETDTMVRISDGDIVAIGGLMQTESARRDSGFPGSSNNVVTGTLFGNQAHTSRKKELVVLIKPTIIRSAEDWARQTLQARSALEHLDEKRRVITLSGPKQAAATAP